MERAHRSRVIAQLAECRADHVHNLRVARVQLRRALVRGDHAVVGARVPDLEEPPAREPRLGGI